MIVGVPVEVRKVTPYRIDFLNVGLFFGQHKVQVLLTEGSPELSPHRTLDDESVRTMYAAAHMGADPSKGLVANLNTVLSGSLPGRQTDLLKKFLATHPDEIRRECTQITRNERGKFSLVTRNLFLTEQVGGMGVLAPVSWRMRVTMTDRCLAAQMILANDCVYAPSRPLPGVEVFGFQRIEGRPWYKPTVETVLGTSKVNGHIPKSQVKRAGEVIRYSTCSCCVLL